MAIPQRSPRNSSSEASLEVKKKLMKKKPLAILARNKYSIKKENIDSVKNPSTGKSEKNSAPTRHGKPPTSASSLDRAKEVQAKLPPECPSCVKFMLRSHVTGGFWLSLPKVFTDIHLPKHDATVVLVDENDEEYYTKYLFGKNGLSGGWRGFSIAHNLLEGDVLVFQLISPCRIKVYIVRANSLSEIDGAISLLNLEQKLCQSIMNVMEPCKTYCHQEAIAMNSQKALNSDNMLAKDRESGNGTDSSGSEMLDGIRFSESVTDFKDMKDFESFSILVDGLVIDSEMPKHLRTKYYDLCCSQNSFLHNHLVKGLNCKLAAGIISETVNIADAIRASKLNTSCDYLQTWDTTLKAFEDMGMTVGFLRDRIKKLVCLQCEEQEIIKSKTLERAQVEMDEKNLEAELLRVKEVKKHLDAEIEALKSKNEKLVITFKEMATAPW